jgi:hypothetical protein
MYKTRIVRALQVGLAAFAMASAPIWAGPPQRVTDDGIRALVADTRERDEFDGADYVVLLDEADVYVRPSGLATTQQCLVTRVLTEGGVRAQCVQRFDYDPDTRRVSVERLRVYRADGSIDDIPLDSVVTQPTVQHMIYWGGAQHLLTIPHLAVGDVIELRVSRTGFNIAYLADAPASGGGMVGDDADTLQPPMPGHWYEVTLFQARHPILRKRYSVHMPKDMPVQYEVYNGELRISLWFADDHIIHTFSAENVPAIKSEPRMVELDDCVPKVVMATLPDWKMKSRWFYEVNEGQFEADDAIRTMVATITAGLTDLDDKIAACNRWVADNIRYYGTSRGPCEGFTLHKGIETFHDRGGVCKDKAGMLVTMLRVLGVEAYAALTMAGSRVEAIPADQFNHTVTVMKEPDGDWRILDPTWIPLSREMWSSRESLQGLVYGTPEGESLTLSPYYPPDYNRLACKAESRIDATGTLDARITMEMTGYPDTYLRRNLESSWRPDITAVFDGVLNIGPTARVAELDFTEPYDYSRDSEVHMRVAAPGYAGCGDGLCLLRLPLMSHPLADWLIPDMFYDVSSEKREYALTLRATRAIEYEEKIQLPQGWQAVSLPPALTVSSPAADLTFTASADGSTVSYSFKLEVKKHMIPPEDYPKYREAIEKMKDISDAWVLVTRPAENGVDVRRAAVDVADVSPGRSAGSAPVEVRHE